MFAAGVDPGSFKVKAPWLQRTDVVAMRISRDGTRAAIAVRRAGRANVFLAGVIRDGQGRPESLTKPSGLMPGLTSVTDLAWIDENHLVVLGGTRADPAARPLVVQIGGTVTPAVRVVGADSVAAGNGPLSILVGSPEGTFARAGARWEPLSTARWPAYAG